MTWTLSLPLFCSLLWIVKWVQNTIIWTHEVGHKSVANNKGWKKRKKRMLPNYGNFLFHHLSVNIKNDGIFLFSHLPSSAQFPLFFVLISSYTVEIHYIRLGFFILFFIVPWLSLVYQFVKATRKKNIINRVNFNENFTASFEKPQKVEKKINLFFRGCLQDPPEYLMLMTKKKRNTWRDLLFNVLI